MAGKVIGTYDVPAEEAPKDPAIIKVAGVEFEVPDVPPSMVWLEFMKAAADGVTDESVEGMAATLRFFEGAMDPDVYGRFLQHCRQRKVPYSTLVKIVGDIWSYYTDRPTTSSVDSSSLSADDATSSEGDSSAKGSSKPGKKLRAAS